MKRSEYLWPWSTAYGAIFVLIVCAALVSACGKKGPPEPQDQRTMFSWADTSAEFAGECLVISATVQGAYENIDSIGLELETVTEEICTDCPFKPSEFPPLSPVSQNEGVFSFQYCPTNQADVYRWRLVGRNLYPYHPHALSPVKLVKKPF